MLTLLRLFQNTDRSIHPPSLYTTTSTLSRQQPQRARAKIAFHRGSILPSMPPKKGKSRAWPDIALDETTSVRLYYIRNGM